MPGQHKPESKNPVIQMQMRFDGLLGFPGGWVHSSGPTNKKIKQWFCSCFKICSCVAAIAKQAHVCHYDVTCRLVNPSKETLEAGLTRELLEEVGEAIPVGVENHVSSCLATSCPRLITHFYIKKMTEAELREIERAAVATATDHGLEVEPCAAQFVSLHIHTYTPDIYAPWFSCYVFVSGVGYGQSTALLPEKRRWSSLFPVSFVHQ